VADELSVVTMREFPPLPDDAGGDGAVMEGVAVSIAADLPNEASEATCGAPGNALAAVAGAAGDPLPNMSEKKVESILGTLRGSNISRRGQKVRAHLAFINRLPRARTGASLADRARVAVYYIGRHGKKREPICWPQERRV